MNKHIPPSAVNWKVSYLRLVSGLSRLRKRHRISQQVMACRLGIARRTFQRWEAGEAELSAMRLFQWAAELGVSIASDLAPPPDQTGRPGAYVPLPDGRSIPVHLGGF